MKTVKLTCNACRLVEEIEDPGPYAPDPPKIGWYHVVVKELRPAPPPPRDPMLDAAKAMGEMLAEQDAPPAARRFLEQMQNGLSHTAHTALAYESPPTPTALAGDFCPTCGPKLLGGVLPHCQSDSPYGPSVIGAR